MKQSTTLALSVFFAIAAAVPFEKRDIYTTTVIEEVTDIVDVYTTVWVAPGDPRLALNQQAVVPTSSSTTPVSTTPIPSSTPASTSSQAAAVVPQQQQQQQAQVKQEAQVAAYAPTSTPTPTPSVAPVVAQPEVKAVAPVQSSSTPVASPSTPQPSSTDSDVTGGSCGEKLGKCVASDVTTFDGGLGSCGFDDATFTKNYFALAHDMMGEGSWDNPNCNRTADIIYNGQTFHAVLQDKCMGCTGASIDLSLPLFNSMFPTAQGTGRFHDIEWHFTS